MTEVHLVVPKGVEDPERPSGGNAYDLRIGAELAARGWTVVSHRVVGRADLGDLLDQLGDSSVVLMDGLVGSALGDVLEPRARRLCLVLLIHLPLGVEAATNDPVASLERRAVAAARRTVVTSEWSRQWLVAHAGADPVRLVVATPGTDPGPVARHTPAGNRLLTVGALTDLKGQQRILTALASLRDLDWTWTCVGSSRVEPHYTAALRAQVDRWGLADRVRLIGTLDHTALPDALADSDLLVVGSRIETYGMAVAESLARGTPVIVPLVGGILEALGHLSGGEPPGLVVERPDPPSLAAALRTWLTDPDLRARGRAAARLRRTSLPRWSETVEAVEGALIAALRCTDPASL